MPTQKTTKTSAAKAAPKKAAPKKTTEKAITSKKEGSLRELRAELYVLKMKHSLRELKETHKIKTARRAIARHLTSINNAK
jgi:ribosomal protein L29